MFRLVKVIGRSLGAGRVLAVTAVLLGSIWAVSPAHAYIYWSTDSFGTIGRANLDGTGVDESWIKDAGAPRGLALGPNGEYIYWAEQGVPGYYESGSIGRAKLDGTGATNAFISPEYADGHAPQDWVAANSAHLYWSEGWYNNSSPPQQGWDIANANLDGTQENDYWLPFNSKVTAVAATNAELYWANVATNTIGRSTSLGGDVNENFITGADDVTGLALGVNGAYIYWSSSNGTIGRANYNGTDPNSKFITGVDDPHAVAVTAAYIYWTNANSTIGRANLDGTDVNEKFIPSAPYAGGLVVNDGPPGTASASPSSLSFGTAQIHTLGQSQIVTITNTGHGVLSITGTQLMSGATGDYKVYESTCSNAKVQPGATCFFHVLFQPTAVGARAATLTVTSVEETAPLEISLSGDGGGVSSSHDSLTGVKAGVPKVAFRLTAVKGAPPIKTISIKLPAGLSFASAKSNLADIKVTGSNGLSTAFTARSSTERMKIKLKAAARKTRIAITSPELLEGKHLEKRAKSGVRLYLPVIVVTTDVHGTSTQLRLEFIIAKPSKLLP